MFGTKIACEQCGKKVRESKSVYRRGSRFCGEACRDAWEAANPPPVARGEPTRLREELAILLDEAFTEAHRRFGPGLDIPFGNSRVRVDIVLTGIDARHRAEAMNEAFMQFQTHTLRSAPILRALGFAAEATMIDSTDFQRDATEPLIKSLVHVRRQL